MQIDFKKISDKVTELLKVDIKCRCSDMWLYTKYLEISNINGITGEEKANMIDLMRKAELPNYSSIMRARQAIQSKEPSLSEKITRKHRRELQNLYREEYSNYGG